MLAAAIHEHAFTYSTHPAEGEFLLDSFAVIAHWQPVGDDDDGTYSTHYSARQVPHHVAVGLFTVGANIVLKDDH